MPGQTCATCAHATKRQEEKPCRECFEEATGENQFPHWEAKNER